jgi:molybdate transport system substrate-binding protein
MEMSAGRENLKVITSGAFAAALVKLMPAFIEESGCEVELSFGSSLGAAHDSIPTRLANGETFDVFFLAASALAAYSAEGHILAASGIDLVESHIGAAVRIEDEAPDIGSVEAFRRTLLAAKSVAHAASASGIYLSTVVFPALGIAEEMKRTARTIYSERVGSVVARGEANLGFQQISEILPIEGVKMIGRLPQEFRRPFVFSAGIGTKSDKQALARELLRFAASQAAGPAIRETGLDPLFPAVG